MVSQNIITVYLNGAPIGTTTNGEKMVTSLREKRRSGELSPHTAITFYENRNEVLVNTDGGRIIRPLIIVENGRPKLKEEHVEKLKKKEIEWNDLIKQGIIEYLDAEEENNCLIAVNEAELTNEHTHLELDPIGLVGNAASFIPFINHNLSNRNLQASKQMKQSIGFYAANYNLRPDTQAYLLSYPQRRLVPTRTTKALELDSHPDAQNAIIALIPYYGYNTQDALVLNKGSVDRGFARATYWKTYKTEEMIYAGGQRDKFEKPGEETTGWRGEEAYLNIGEDGLITPESYVTEGDVLVSGSAPPKFLEEISDFGIIEEKRREKSLDNKAGSNGHVDSVILSESTSGTVAAKIKVRCEQIPEIGDKFSSMHYQKGVIGAIIPEYDVPFTREGIKPDVIINPAAIPTRMIMGQIVEALTGKAASISAERYDGTAFTKVDDAGIHEILKSAGYRYDGKEVMYDGITGEKIEAEIFMGVGYYRRLTHLVSTIIQARGKGRVQMLTRQPTEGKARQGGLKFEEMQRDCLVGYGAAMLLQDRLLYNADRTMFPVCEKCGLIARTDSTKGNVYCPACKGHDISDVAMPYAFKLALDEMMSMHIYPKLKVRDMV